MLIDFVDKKLSLHHTARDITKFYLDSRTKFVRIEEWVTVLFTRHNLEEFILYMQIICLGMASFLQVGHMDHWLFWSEIHDLKICRLRNAILHVYSEDLKQHFFSNVPWSKSDQLLISAPVLKYLLITGPNEATDIEDSFPFNMFKINIFAPNLLSFRYNDLLAKDYILHHFGSLVDVEIDFKRFDIPLPQEKDPTATKALKELSNVKRLKISGETFQGLFFPDTADDLVTNWPMFHNLVHLEVTSEISFSKDKTLLNFLRISPNLKTIIIAKGFVGQQYSTDSGWTPDMVPQCVLLHLKSVEFCEFYGCLEELNAVKTILKNARVLRRMVIKFPLLFSTDKQNKVMKKLLKFSRSSKSCIIEIS
ncbi:hypothetical protein MKX03_022224 [Papaver bracteatum]|nr:hypothetical protein MKX03_022224 [Papaver bracteatum]